MSRFRPTANEEGRSSVVARNYLSFWNPFSRSKSGKRCCRDGEAIAVVQCPKRPIGKLANTAVVEDDGLS